MREDAVSAFPYACRQAERQEFPVVVSEQKQSDNSDGNF